MTPATHTRLYLTMRLRRLAKTLVKLARIACVSAFAVLRAAPPLRRALHLPSNNIAPLTLASANGMRVRNVDPAEPFLRKMPNFAADETAPPESLVRAQAGACPATFVVEIDDGYFWSHGGGVAMTHDRRIVPELSKDVWGPRLRSAYARPVLPRPRRLAGLTLSLVTPEAAGNYHHWTMDCLSRAGLAERAGFELRDFDYVLVKHRGHPYQNETLARLGFAPDQLVRVGNNAHFETDLLVVPAVRHDNMAVNRADTLYVRRLFLPDEPPASAARRRLYVGRRDAAFRRVLNEDAFMPMLRALGFEEVSMSRLSVREQAKLFSEAEIIVGPNGAALSNLVYANRACRVIEFFAPGWVVPYHWVISANLGLDYTALIGRGPRSSPREIRQDIEIDVAQFEAALKSKI